MNILLTIFTILTVVFSSELTLVNDMFSNKKYIEADELIKSLITKDSTNPSFYEVASKINLKLDDLLLANKNITKAIELDPSNEEYRVFWNKLNDIRSKLNDAQKSFENGFIDESINAYEKIVVEYSEFALGYYNFGLIYYRIDDFDNAVYNFKKALLHNPFNDKYKQSITNIAAKLTQKGNDEYRRSDYESAIKFYAKAVEYDPTFSESRFKIALIKNKLS